MEVPRQYYRQTTRDGLLVIPQARRSSVPAEQLLQNSANMKRLLIIVLP